MKRNQVDFCKYNQDLKDKVDALSKEITQLKEKVRVDSAITVPLVLKQLLRLAIAIIMLRMMKPCLVVYNREFKIPRLRTTTTFKHATAHDQNHVTVHFSRVVLRLR